MESWKSFIGGGFVVFWVSIGIVGDDNDFVFTWIFLFRWICRVR